MSAFDDFNARAANGVALTHEDNLRVLPIMGRVRGYSTGKHYAFFKTLLALPQIRDVLMLGVYHGRDIALMRDCLKQSSRTDVRIVGVDKFSDTPCADWPEGSAGKKWEGAGFGPPPSLEQARRNCMDDPAAVTLIESTDVAFLVDTPKQFDAVYLDTSHDYLTVVRQLVQVPRVCRGDAIICGDDYSDESNMPGGNWGVQRAVSEAFAHHTVFADWIWISSLSLLKNQQ